MRIAQTETPRNSLSHALQRLGGIGPAALALVMAAAPAWADFEGEMDMKVTVSGHEKAESGSTMKAAISKAGTRMEMSSQRPDMTLKTVILVLNDSPDKVYKIDDAQKTYTVIDVSEMQKMAPESNDEVPWTVEKLGEEEILGYKTRHVRVTHGDTVTEMWNAQGLLDYKTFARMQSRQRGVEGLFKALKDADADGVPLRSTVVVHGGPATTKMEVVRIEKKSLPASLFEVPAGYTETQGGMMGGMSGPRADEMRQRLQDAMKNMTPEQRDAMQKAMQRRQGAAH